MANVIIDDTNLTNIANAIRGKNGTTDTYKPSEMAAAITALSTGSSGGGEIELGIQDAYMAHYPSSEFKDGTALPPRTVMIYLVDTSAITGDFYFTFDFDFSPSGTGSTGNITVYQNPTMGKLSTNYGTVQTGMDQYAVISNEGYTSALSSTTSKVSGGSDIINCSANVDLIAIMCQVSNTSTPSNNSYGDFKVYNVKTSEVGLG